MIRKNFYNITPYDNLLILESFGLWDSIVAKECFEDIWKIVELYYPDKSYSIIDNITKWDLNTPCAVDFWKETFELDIHFPTYVVYVVGESELKQRSVRRIFDDSVPFEVAFFGEISEAVAWLESHGYHMPHSTPT